MYRIKLLGTSWKGMVRALSLQNREYGTDLEDIKYVNSFPNHSVLDKSFRRGGAPRNCEIIQGHR